MALCKQFPYLRVKNYVYKDKQRILRAEKHNNCMNQLSQDKFKSGS
jgi:hypothetical protein